MTGWWGGCDGAAWLFFAFIQRVFKRHWQPTLEHSIPGFIPCSDSAGTCRWLLKSLFMSEDAQEPRGLLGQIIES